MENTSNPFLSLNGNLEDLDNKLRRRLGLEDLPKITIEEWEDRLAQEKVDTNLMNKLVMDYLVTHCDRETVNCFKNESHYYGEIDKILELREQLAHCFIHNDFGGALALLSSEIGDFENLHEVLALELRMMELVVKCVNHDAHECVLYVREKINPKIRNKVSFWE